MSTASTKTSPSGLVISPENLLFDYPEADIILRSRDSYDFRVLKLYIVNSSPVLGEKLLLSPDRHPKPSAPSTPVESNVEGTTAANLPSVVQLPVDGAILLSLLTYIFPVQPILPFTVEHIMELLSVAQMYKMNVVLTYIRMHIAQREPPFIREETAFLIYSLSQKYGLRTEALQAARCTLSFSSLTIENLSEEKKLDLMPGAFLYELWKYHQRVRSNLTSDLKEFRISNALTILGDSSCDSLANSGLPVWLDKYISDIGTARVPAFLDLTGFHMQLAEHIEKCGPSDAWHSCSSLSRKEILAFWGALTVVVHSSIAKAEPDFSLPVEGTKSEGQARPTHEATSPQKYSDMPNADVILQSSDLVHFRVHRSVLVASSPFFGDMFSLPQLQNDAAPFELPVVYLSEDAEVLNSLISILYPVPPEIPRSSDNILALLAAAAKYDMDEAQSSIRAEVSRKGLLSSTPTDVFRVYAVACNKGLIPEVETAARLTLGHPLTFESLGDALRLFEGWALRDLADFRLRSICNFCSNWQSLTSSRGPSKIWVGCPMVKCGKPGRPVPSPLPIGLQDCLRLRFTMGVCIMVFERLLPVERFTETIPASEQLCDKYLKALQKHVNEDDCHFCMKVHILEGENFGAKMKAISEKAWNVTPPMLGERPGIPKMVYNSSEKLVTASSVRASFCST